MEIVIVAVLIVGVLIYNKTIDKDKFIKDNAQYFDLLREDDYNFLVMAKYGDKVDSDVLFQKRVILGIVTIFVVMFVSMNSLSLLNILLAVVIGFLAFKYPYMGLKNYYKKHLHNIDVMLPYYLKGLEILIQHYTVPVAIGKSIEDAPDLFKPGLRNMIEKINAGDSTIQPYMDFANEYPVRDSMRMMRLLYRLGIGGQERKQERLLMFSKTVSNLQAKARETKYKERLDHMGNQTMIMLVVTGISVMFLIVISLMKMTF
jgi:hypothetical protein